MPSRPLFVFSTLALASAAWAGTDQTHAAIAVLLAALATLAAGAAWLESGPPSVKDLTLVATLGGVAAAGRVLFAPVPNVQPVTVVVAAAGAALGARRGFAVGALAALASNFFLGQGAHTPWQMVAWGGCGVAGALVRHAVRGRLAFALFTFALGFAYGVPMDVWTWLVLDGVPLASVLAAGLAFNAAHAVGNLLIAFAAGPEVRQVLERYDRRLRTEVLWG